MSQDFSIKYQNLINLIPSQLRNPTVVTIVDNLFNRFLTAEETIPLYGYVGVPSPETSSLPLIKQQTVERAVNTLLPVFSFKLGSQDYSFTPQDIIRKMSVLGASDNQSTWLYSQGNNFAPPIDFDKFSNFYNYYWVAKALNSDPLSWNPDLVPEYYCIQKPNNSSLNKLNVVTATTSNIALTGSGFFNQVWNVTFSSATEFTISAIGPQVGFLPGQQTQSFSLSAIPTSQSNGSWNVLNDIIEFKAGNPLKTLLTLTFKREPLFDVNGTLIQYETFAPNDRFTIDAPFISTIYTLTFTGSIGAKGGISSVNTLSTYQTIGDVLIKKGDRVLVKDNPPIDNGIYIVSENAWVKAADFSQETSVANAKVWVRYGANARKLFSSVASGSGWNWTLLGSDVESNISDWQQYNFWVSRSELASLGLSVSDAEQAVRPIIEYKSGIKLNSFVKDGLPSDSGISYTQLKSQINQIPLFDVYHYDGTHANKASSIFFYVEDHTEDIDPALQKRVKYTTGASRDFVFDHGLYDEFSTTFFYKIDNQLKSIWHPGYTAPTVVDQAFSGEGNGTLTVSLANVSPFVAQQIWTLTAISPTQFSVVGSKNKVVNPPFNIITVDQPYNYVLFGATITNGSIPFAVGDTFTFRVGNLETARYSRVLENGEICDVCGGFEYDSAKIGAWKIPKMFYTNISGRSGGEVSEGSVNSHIKSVLANQPIGLEENRSFGGSIKLWSEPVNLLSSLLMQRDLTPITLVDLAERQYQNAYMSLITLYQSNVMSFIAANGIIDTEQKLNVFVDHLLNLRALDDDVKTILFDSTSPVIGFPPTLPQMGAVPLYAPTLTLDDELGVLALQRHDGSLFPLFTNNADFLDQFVPPGTATPQDLAQLLNDVIATIEVRLFKGISAQQKTYFSGSDIKTALTGPLASYLHKELANWSAANNYDLYGSDYEAGNAFTWNYSSANTNVCAPVSTTEIPARWFNFLQAHQSTVANVIPTSRPDLHPWKLLGLVEDPGVSFDVYRSQVTPADLNSGFIDGGSVSAVSYSAVPLSTSLQGLPLIDGYQCVEGQKVLLTSEGMARNNGIWVVSSGNWVRDNTVLDEGTVVFVENGQLRNNTRWYLLNDVENINVDDVNFVQVRNWTDALWTYIQAQRPTLKISVNPYTDELLPPYVNGSLIVGQFALTNTIPANTSSTYEFGESSPVETAWTRTAEFRYSLVRALFLKDPLSWLNHLWGMEWVKVDNIPYCMSLLSMPTTENLPLHGESINAITRKSPIRFDSIIGPANTVITIIRDAYTSDNKQGWTVFANGSSIGYLKEGIIYESISSSGITFTNLQIEDEGKPFSLDDRFEITINQLGFATSALFVPINRRILHGFCQIFAFALRNSSISDQNGYALKAYRSWVPNLGYRAGGLVSQDDLKIDASNGDISSSAYELRLKKSRYAKDSWLHALRVKVVAFGSSYSAGGKAFVPATNANDWVFRVEGYNDRYTEISFYELIEDSNFVTFNALDKTATALEWKRYETTNSLRTTQLPLTITGLQNVINFLFGYEYKLIEDGWRFDDPTSSAIDPETGRIKSWQLEVEKLIDRVFRGIAEGQGTVINPFLDKVWFDHPKGLLSEFNETMLFDINSDPAIFDIFGTKIQSSEMSVLRQRERSEISSTVPIFSAHAQLDEIEHLFVFNNYAQPSLSDQLLYDPYSGAQVANIVFNGRFQGNATLRPEVGGYFLSDGQLKRNIRSSVDSVATMYDPNIAFENSVISKQAFSLLGFSLKDYMSDLDLTDKTQFNFWRGLVHMKGTNESIDAFLNNGRFADTELDEFWAYKIAEYGDSRSKVFPELKVQSSDTIQQFTKLQFDSNTPLIDFTQISSSDEDRWFSIEDIFDKTKFEVKTVGQYDIVDGANAIDTSWWNVNASLPIGWSIYGSIPENRFEVVSSYYGTTEAMWIADAGAAGATSNGQDGGWSIGGFTSEIDRNKTYRFILPVKRITSENGTIQFGLSGVSTLNTPNEASAQFFVSVSLPEADVWYAIVGYVYPVGSTGNTHSGAGLFKIETGELISSGTNFNWHDLLPIRHKAHLTNADAGTQVIFGKPAAHMIDGFEPTLSNIFAGKREIVKLPFIADELIISGEASKINDSFIQFNNPYPAKINISGYGPNASNFTPLKLINYVDNELVEDISLWHPAAGYHTTTAIESINIISNKDPAKYNSATQVTGNANYDPLRSWGAKEVGRIWLDTTKLKYVPYFDSVIFDDIEQRLNRWGTLADFGSVDVLEWVESSVAPSDYAAQSVLDAVNPDLPNNLKAEGTVYGSSAYSRNRQWQMSPIAWSFAGRPESAAHTGGMIGSRGSFSADYDAGLYFVEDENGVGEVLLDAGTFAEAGITLGMHFGEFEDTPTNLRARSENVITAFAKAVYAGTGDNYLVITNGERFTDAIGNLNLMTAKVSLDLDAGTELTGELILSNRNEVIPIYDTDGITTGKQVVKSYVRVRVPGTTLDEEVLVREDQGSIGIQLYAIDTAAVIAGMYQAATNTEPGKTLFKDTLIGTRSLGDISNEGDVSYYDVAMYQAWVDGTITEQVMIDYIENVFNQYILSNPTIYAAYINNVEIVATDATTIEIEPNQVFNIRLPNLGININVECLNSETIVVPSTTIAQLVVNELSINRQLRVLDAARYDVIVPGLGLSYLTNDFSDPASFADDSGLGGIGWRAWSVPTQAQLDADSKYPNSSWYPMVGPLSNISTPLLADIQDIAETNGTITLNNGTVIYRYKSGWTDWEIISDIMIEQPATSSGSLEIELPLTVDASRLSVYINGIAQLSGTYSIKGTTLTIFNVIRGHEITVIIRAYSPTIEELQFNPDVEDDMLQQTHYKVDYQYVEMPVRDTSGTILSTKYYFWVKNRSIIAAKKKLSVKSIAEQLRVGPEQYLTFQNLIDSTYYDAVTVSGLSQLVSKDDTFKLRFTRDLTLRDDPNGLDLKDTHTEWGLIRPKQRGKIPESLWIKMVDSACQQDLAGNKLPSTRRTSYDLRNGTSSRYGFGNDQVLADSELIKSTLLHTILNTKLTESSGDLVFADYISFLDYSDPSSWFATKESTRSILTQIWNKAKPSQINELFFAVLEDVVAANYELTDIFKTSRLSVQSVREVESFAYVPTYE